MRARQRARRNSPTTVSAVKAPATLFLSCGLAGCLTAHGQAVTPKSCRASDLGARPVTVAGRHRVFVEPQAVALSGTGLLVAGAPSYVWTKTDSSFTLARDSVVAIIAESSGASTIVRGPLGPGRAHSVRAAGLNGGQWILAFAEGAPLARPSEDPDVSSIWVGVVDARGTWLRLEKLPSVTGRLLTDRASLSALSAENVAVAVPVERNNIVGVSVFVRANGHWRASQVMTREANYTALTFENTRRLALGVVHVDPSGAADNNSLWLYRTGDAGEPWSSPIRLVRGFGQPVHHPQFSMSRGRMTAVWLTRIRGTSEARFFGLTSRDSVSELGFGEGAAQVFPENRLGAVSVWTTYHQPSPRDPAAYLRLWESVSYETPHQVAAFSVPFDGSVGVAANDRLILAAGPVRGTSSSEPPVSLVLHRFALRCD